MLVKSKTEKLEKAPTTLKTAKLLTMQENDIAKIDDVELLPTLLSTKKNLTHTKNIAQTALPSSDEFEVVKEGLSLLSARDINFLTGKQDEVASGTELLISSEIAYQEDEKKIPTEKQLSQITAALN